MKLYLVQGEHPSVPGNPMLPFATPASADAAARDLVNTIRLEPYGFGDADDEDMKLPQLEGEFDWQEALREWQRANLIANGLDATEVGLMDDDELADGAECTVWIIALDMEEPTPTMEFPGGPDDVNARAEARLKAHLDVINDFDRPATAADYADYLTTLAWAKCGGHYNREGAALIGAAHMLLELAPAGPGASCDEIVAGDMGQGSREQSFGGDR